MSDIRLLDLTSDDRVRFSVEDVPRLQTRGLAHLIQVVVNQLLTTPGSDRLNQKRGGGLADLTRRYRTNSQELRQQIAGRIQEVQTQIVEEQKQLTLPPEEKVESISVESISTDENDPSVLNINLIVRAQSGDAAEVTL
jgi:hypothetical protein